VPPERTTRGSQANAAGGGGSAPPNSGRNEGLNGVRDNSGQHEKDARGAAGDSGAIGQSASISLTAIWT
jgi:hypothetical protein